MKNAVNNKMTKGKYRVKTLTMKQGVLLNIDRFPNFHRTGSVSGMKNLYYGIDSLLVRCGNYIYNVKDEQDIYFKHAL